MTLRYRSSVEFPNVTTVCQVVWNVDSYCVELKTSERWALTRDPCNKFYPQSESLINNYKLARPFSIILMMRNSLARWFIWLQDAARGVYGRNRDLSNSGRHSANWDFRWHFKFNHCMATATIRYVLSFYHGTNASCGPWLPLYRGFTITLRHIHTRQDSSEREITQRHLPDSIKLLQQTDIHPLAELAPAVPASERPQTYALGRAATGIGWYIQYSY